MFLGSDTITLDNTGGKVFPATYQRAHITCFIGTNVVLDFSQGDVHL